VGNRVNYIVIAIAFSIFILSISYFAFADSCPYCKREYPDPMPGDEARVYELRRQHEAGCSARQQPSSSSANTGYSGDGHQGAKTSSFDYDAFFRQRQQQALEKQRQLRLWQQQEEETKLTEREKNKKEQFQNDRQELLYSLKGASQAKGLKIKEVPSPLSLESTTVQPQLQLKGSATESSGDTGMVKKALKQSYIKTKESMAGKIKEKMFEESLNPFPGATYVKSLYDRYKEMREEMESLNLNIFQYAMKSIKDGVKKLASPSLSDGGFADEYEEGRENLFGRTSAKVRKWLKKEVEK